MSLEAVQEKIFKTPERLMSAAGVLALGIGSFFVYYFDPSKAGFFPGCPLLNLTGFACPGCGLTRGFHEFFHGHFLAALDYNALVPIYAVVFAFLAVLFTSIAVRGRDLKFTIFSPTTLTIFLIISGTFGVLRNIPADPFRVLFP